MVLEQRTNRHKIDDQRLPMMQRAVTFDGPEHLSTWHAVVSKSKLARDLRRTTSALIAHLGSGKPPYIQLNIGSAKELLNVIANGQHARDGRPTHAPLVPHARSERSAPG